MLGINLGATIVGVVVAASSLYFPAPALAQARIEVLEIDPSANGLLKANLVVAGLSKRNHGYKLTLNGYLGKNGNELLKRYDVTPAGEGYFDFQDVRSDDNGGLKTIIQQSLPRGQYIVKFLIKDPEGWSVVAKKEPVVFEIR